MALAMSSQKKQRKEISNYIRLSKSDLLDLIFVLFETWKNQIEKYLFAVLTQYDH